MHLDRLNPDFALTQTLIRGPSVCDQDYIWRVVRPKVLFDYRGRAPDAFSAFLDELIHLC